MEVIINRGYKDRPENIDICTEDGRRAFTIRLINEYSIEVYTAHHIKVDDKIYDDKLVIIPQFCNSVILEKPLYK